MCSSQSAPWEADLLARGPVEATNPCPRRLGKIVAELQIPKPRLPPNLASLTSTIRQANNCFCLDLRLISYRLGCDIHMPPHLISGTSDKAPPSLSETSKSGDLVIEMQGSSRLPGRGATWGSCCTVHGLCRRPIQTPSRVVETTPVSATECSYRSR